MIYTNNNETLTKLPLKERIKLAKEHILLHDLQQDCLWSYQRFAMSIKELLDAAERGS